MSLHPELSKLVGQFNLLREHVSDGSLSPEEASEALFASSAIDGAGYEWRINPSGYFTRSTAGGGLGSACDPSLFTAPVLPAMRGVDGAGPFPYTVHAAESPEESALRWAEVRKAHASAPVGSSFVGKLISEVGGFGSKAKGAAVVSLLRGVDRSEGWMVGRWSKAAFWVGVCAISAIYLSLYK